MKWQGEEVPQTENVKNADSRRKIGIRIESIETMTETESQESIWLHDSLEVDDEGYVIGSAYTEEFLGGYTVDVGVFSYEYERHGESRMNHVPNVVVSDPEGRIVAEPHSWDSGNPETAIRNAKATGELVYDNPQDFVEA